MCGFFLIILKRIARKLGLELNQILSHAKHSESHIKPTKYQIIKLLSTIQTTWKMSTQKHRSYQRENACFIKFLATTLNYTRPGWFMNHHRYINLAVMVRLTMNTQLEVLFYTDKPSPNSSSYYIIRVYGEIKCSNTIKIPGWQRNP